MKNVLYKIIPAFLLLFIAGFSGCGNPPNIEPSVPRFDKNSKYTIFEIKYGQDTTITFDNTSIQLSLYDAIDSIWINCSFAEFINGAEKTVKLHAFLNVTIENVTSNLKVSSKSCGPYEYIPDSIDKGMSDIEEIIGMIDEWGASINPDYLSQEFASFGTPVSIGNTSYYINMAKGYPIEPDFEVTDKNLFKFIFILWTNN
jgi:hypothetical protein